MHIQALMDKIDKLQEQVFIQDAYLYDYKLAINKFKTKLKAAEDALEYYAIYPQNIHAIEALAEIRKIDK